METKKDRTAVIALIAGGIALLLGLCLGALSGGAVGFLIGRQANERALQRTVIESEEAPGLQPETPARPELPDLMNGNGALVREVVAGSPAAEAGLEAGDLITAVNEIPIDSDHPLATVVGTFQPGDRVEVTVMRLTKELTISLTLGASPNNPKQAYIGVYYVDISTLRPQPND